MLIACEVEVIINVTKLLGGMYVDFAASNFHHVVYRPAVGSAGGFRRCILAPRSTAFHTSLNSSMSPSIPSFFSNPLGLP